MATCFSLTLARGYFITTWKFAAAHARVAKKAASYAAPARPKRSKKHAAAADDAAPGPPPWQAARRAPVDDS